MVGNLVRRVLKLVREEHSNALKGAAGTNREEEHQQQQQDVQGLHRMLQSQSVDEELCGATEGDVEERRLSVVVPGLKATVLDGVDELMSELEAAADEISNQVCPETLAVAMKRAFARDFVIIRPWSTSTPTRSS